MNCLIRPIVVDGRERNLRSVDGGVTWVLSNEALDEQERALVSKLRAYRALHRDRLPDLLRQVVSTDSGTAETCEKGYVRRITGKDGLPMGGVIEPQRPLVRAG
jgi:hypothetical protein